MDLILDFFKNRLEAHLARKFGPTASGVSYLNSADWDPISFPNGQITFLILNIEEEKIMRPDHLYQTENSNGDVIHVMPPLRLNFFFLFVAKFTDNKEAWKQLYEVISYFQQNKHFTAQNAPDLPPDAQKLIMELKSLSFTEQNEIWSSLKAAYHPSVMYRMKVHLVQTEIASSALPVEELNPQLGNK